MLTQSAVPEFALFVDSSRKQTGAAACMTYRKLGRDLLTYLLAGAAYESSIVANLAFSSLSKCIVSTLLSAVALPGSVGAGSLAFIIRSDRLVATCSIEDISLALDSEA